MSSKRKRKAFDAPSRVTEKYLDILESAQSSETYQPSEHGKKDDAALGTDTPLGDSIPASNVITKSWQMPKWLESILKTTGYIVGVASLIGIIVAVCVFFINLNSAVDSANEKIVDVQSDVNELEREVRGLSNGQNDIKLSIVNIVNKIERLFDRIGNQR